MYKFLLRRKIKKLVAHSEREKAFQNIKEIKSILVFFNTEDFEEANFFIQQLKKMDKKVKAFAFKDRNDANTYSKITYTIVTEKDMNGESLSHISNSLTDEKFDLVVDFTLSENLLLLYILVSVNSPLKVGFYKHALSVHDMVIWFVPGLVQNVKELGTQLIHYLTIISSDTRSGS
jgi:hypothetical protein